MQATLRRMLLATIPALVLALASLLLPGAAARATAVGDCVVTTTADSGAGSLRAAIGDTNCTSITFSLPNPSTITLTTGALSIGRNLTITGPGADKLTVARSAATGTADFTVFYTSGGTFGISGLTISGGRNQYGGGIQVSDGTATLTRLVISGNASTYFGGGLAVIGGTATLTESVVSGNEALDASSGVAGGVFSFGGAKLRVERSLITGNRARFGGGATNYSGTENGGNLTLVNSSIVGNTAVFSGGGVLSQGWVTLLGSTVSGNSGGEGANMYTQATIRLQSTIIANGLGGANCDGTITDLGDNLADDSTCGLSAANNSLSNTPAGLDPVGLRDNGGPTRTVALLPGSPAIDRVPATGANCPATDQRGIARFQVTACDSGAFESRGFTAVTSSGYLQRATINAAFASPLTLTLSSANGEPVAGGVVTFTGPASGAGIQGSPLAITIGADGQASASVTANGVTGDYLVRGTVRGMIGVGALGYTLTNTTIPTALVAQSASGKFGHTATLSATLTGAGGPLSGKPIAFTLNGTPVGSANTDASGVATLSNASLAGIAEGTYPAGVGASFAGDASYGASSGGAQLSVTPAVCVVTSAADSGAGTLRAAIGQTDGFSGCDTITFSLPDPSTITLASDLPTIGRTVSIIGPGVTSLTVDRNDGGTGRAFPVAPAGDLTLRGLTVRGAFAAVFLDGGGAVTLDRCTLSANSFGVSVRYSGTVTARDSTFSGNTDSGISLNFSPGPTATVTGSTFVGNNNGLTFSSGGSATVANSTFVGNNAGILNIGGSATVANSTFVGNNTGLANGVGSATMTNTLFAKSASANCTGGGTVTNAGHNLADDARCFAEGSGPGGSSHVVAAGAAGLDPAGLRDNGGPTQTVALLPGSPAIDAGDNAACVATPVSNADQRGIARPQGSTCDIGAFESRGFTLAYTSGGGQSAAINAAFGSPLVATVASTNGEPVQGGGVTFTGPGSGAGLANSPLTATIAANGQASASVTANGTTGGPYTVAASAAGATGTANYSLTNTTIPTTLTVDPASGTYGGTVTLSATLTATSSGAGVAGKTITFTLNGTAVGSANTNASGVATLSNVALGAIGANTYGTGVGASFAADATHAGSVGNAQLAVAQATSTTTLLAPDAAYTGNPYAGASATATGAGGLNTPVTDLTYTGRNGTTYGLSATPPTGAGDYTVSASFAGDANHTGSGKTADFAITKANQTITFATPSASPAPAYTYGTDSGFTVGGTATSGLTVGFASTTGGVCTVAGTQVTILGAGDCTIVASQGGDANRAAAPAVQRTFPVGKATSTTTVTAPNAAYTGTPYAEASARATGFGGLNQAVAPLSYAGRNGTTYGPSATPPTNVGDYTASASFAGDANHTGSTGSADFAITRASQTIIFNPNPLPNRSIGEAPFAVAATATSGLTVALAAGPSGVCTVSGGTVTLVGIGTCTVTANQGGDANHLPAAEVTRPFQVLQATTGTVARGEATYGDTTATLTATVTRTSDGQPVPQGGTVTFTFGGASYTAQTNAQGVAAVSVSLPRGQAAGTFAGRVQAAYAGVTAALPSSGTGPLVVARRILTVKPVDQTVRLGQPNPTGCALELAPGSAFVNGDGWSAINLANLRCTTSRNYPNSNAAETVGKTYKISASGFSSGNYDLRLQQGTLTVIGMP